MTKLYEVERDPKGFGYVQQKTQKAPRKVRVAKPKVNGFVFYKGPSVLDGAPIVAILTGLQNSSANEKTGGGLYQTWILREDVNPLIAVNTGDDASICGGGKDGCKHRGTLVKVRKSKKHPTGTKNVGRSCYVRLDTAPNNIFKTYKRGRYPHVSPSEARFILKRYVRGGSYGDPAAVPYWVWELMLGLAEDTLPEDERGGTAYTHQWRKFPELATFCMASVDTADERVQAKLLGYRTFRVRGEHEPIGEYEVACPASKEAGYKTTCDLCRACGGNNAKAKADIVIAVHGSGKAKHFAEAVS